MKKVTAPQVATAQDAMKADLPEAVQEALGDLAGATREGLTGPRSSVNPSSPKRVRLPRRT